MPERMFPDEKGNAIYDIRTSRSEFTHILDNSPNTAFKYDGTLVPSSRNDLILSLKGNTKILPTQKGVQMAWPPVELPETLRNII